MDIQNLELEKARVLRYVLSRISSLGPMQLEEMKEKVKERTMETCRLDSEEYEELLLDLQKRNGWSEALAIAYFETSVMFE